MTIFELDTVDILGKTADGSPLLAIIDPGDLPPDERLVAFKAKLEAYSQLIASAAFQQEYPGWKNATIQLMGPVKPTAAMHELIKAGIMIPDNPSVPVFITYQTLASLE